jgi:hypothetical protein
MDTSPFCFCGQAGTREKSAATKKSKMAEAQLAKLGPPGKRQDGVVRSHPGMYRSTHKGFCQNAPGPNAKLGGLLRELPRAGPTSLSPVPWWSTISLSRSVLPGE